MESRIFKDSSHNFIGDILPILVIYNCPIEQSATWQSLIPELSTLDSPLDLFIYDNSPSPQTVSNTRVHIHYQHDGTNSGVSRAYNEGFKLAKKLKKKWLLLLDQDSFFPQGWLASYYAISKAETEIAVPIAISDTKIISPFKYWGCVGRSPTSIEPGIKLLRDYYAINSGLLISLKLYETIGGYDETILLDFSDFAFMHKLKTQKVSLYVLDLSLNHNLSSFHNESVTPAKDRFRLYTIGSRKFSEYTKLPAMHFLVGFLRALKLGVEYKTLGFLKIFMEIWVID